MVLFVKYEVELYYTIVVKVKSYEFAGQSTYCVSKHEIDRFCSELSNMDRDINGHTIISDFDSDAYLEFEVERNGVLTIKGQIGGTHEYHFVKFKMDTDQTVLKEFIKDLKNIW